MYVVQNIELSDHETSNTHPSVPSLLEIFLERFLSNVKHFLCVVVPNVSGSLNSSSL